MVQRLQMQNPTHIPILCFPNIFKMTEITAVLSTGEVTTIVLRTATAVGSWSNQGLQSLFKTKSGMEISLGIHFDISPKPQKNICMYFSLFSYKHQVIFKIQLSLHEQCNTVVMTLLIKIILLECLHGTEMAHSFLWYIIRRCEFDWEIAKWWFLSSLPYQ